MTNEFATESGRENFRIDEREGCVLAFGPIPLTEFSNIAKRFKKADKAVIDIHLARLLGATLVCGVRKDLDRLTQIAEPEAIARAHLEYREDRTHLSQEAITWLAIGRQGTSSQVLFQVATGITPMGLNDPKCTDIPSDANDFDRCALLYEQVPEVQKNLARARTISTDWARIVDHWDSLLYLRQANEREGIRAVLRGPDSAPRP